MSIAETTSAVPPVETRGLNDQQMDAWHLVQKTNERLYGYCNDQKNVYSDLLCAMRDGKRTFDVATSAGLDQCNDNAEIARSLLVLEVRISHLQDQLTRGYTQAVWVGNPDDKALMEWERTKPRPRMQAARFEPSRTA